MACFVVLAGIAIADPSRGDTHRVGISQFYQTPAAAAIAKKGDHVETEPRQYFDCAVWSADNLVMRAPALVLSSPTRHV